MTTQRERLRNADTGGATPEGQGRPLEAGTGAGAGIDTPQSALSTGNTTGDVKSGATEADDIGALNIDEADLDVPAQIMERDPGPARDDFESEPLTDRIEDEEEGAA